jgi:hypothetical protein
MPGEISAFAANNIDSKVEADGKFQSEQAR